MTSNKQNPFFISFRRILHNIGISARSPLKYFEHGFLFSMVNVILRFVWPFLLASLFLIGAIIGLIINFLILFLVYGRINSYLTHKLWKVPMKTQWKNLLPHGIVLVIAFIIISIPGLAISAIINVFAPSLLAAVIFLIILFTVYCFVDGYVAKGLALHWQKELLPITGVEVSFSQKVHNIIARERPVLPKYFAHGILFSVINSMLLFFVWIFLLTSLFLINAIIGVIISFLVLFVAEGGINSYLTHKLWNVPIKTNWKSLLLHGIGLAIALTIISVPALIINAIINFFSPGLLISIFAGVIIFIVYCFVDGYIAKGVALNWQQKALPKMGIEVSIAFLLPAFLLLVVFVIGPVVVTVYQSFLDRTGVFVGLQNYNYVLFKMTNPLINLPNIINFPYVELGIFPLGSMIHNMLWISIHLPLIVLFGLGFAVLLRGVWGGTLIKSIVFLGVVIPMVVGGVLFRFIYDKDAGILNEVLRQIGLGSFTRNWLAFSNTALISLIMGSVWIWTGFAMIIYSAALEGIPIELYEAAEIDGASRWKTFWRITVPMLRSTTIVVITLTVLWELKVFDIVYVATSGGPGSSSSVMAYDMYIEAFTARNYGSASAIAVLLTLMTFGVAAYMVNRMSKP
jgi:multiple sugar transport system permease protein